MQQLKKGLRLNDQNRKQIVDAIIRERLGTKLDNMEDRRTDICTVVESALFAAAKMPEEIDVSSIPLSVLPTTKRHYLQDGYAVPEYLLDFKREIRVPFKFYSQGSIDRWEFKFNKDELAILEAFAADDCQLRNERKDLFEKLMTHLNGFTSPQKLIVSSPDFEQYLPADMYDEEAAQEQTSLDDILAA